ncbi:hypothetical protein EKN56_10560 [Limnobaculum zhutongyuii]|uniref:Uncharacterized protein n=1 Tax=Limnobaculum zhutongyuii TaxID=2498113 RepID=A0A411WKY5_9GAMM|nr:hypothetical protein [Limnobaculum zhutongyuii]QBH96810.1 hypothetical protein EKN56_10560 [Limnobaculum zhutongyuii]TQS90159.1 hypothetical protein ELQ32_02030 [Limnobaculum zhutongyuii]
MNAQQFNQQYPKQSLFYLRTFSGQQIVRTTGLAHHCSEGQVMVEINRNPWFVSIHALRAVPVGVVKQESPGPFFTIGPVIRTPLYYSEF